jgi:hypothetical protein
VAAPLAAGDGGGSAPSWLFGLALACLCVEGFSAG